MCCLVNRMLIPKQRFSFLSVYNLVSVSLENVFRNQLVSKKQSLLGTYLPVRYLETAHMSRLLINPSDSLDCNTRSQRQIYMSYTKGVPFYIVTVRIQNCIKKICLKISHRIEKRTHCCEGVYFNKTHYNFIKFWLIEMTCLNVGPMSP
jgi:hypothetical protein